MACESCGEKKEHKREFPSAVVEINNPERLVLLRKVVIPASMGDETAVPASVGKYRNVVLQYEVNKHVYLYSSDGIPTLIDTRIPQEILDRIDALEDEDVHLQEEIDELKNSPDVVDIVATYEELMDYDTSSLGDNDAIRVLTDETHDNESSYYRWDKTNSQWVFIGAVEGYYTKDQTDDLLDEKQDKLTAGSNINIDANNVISGAYTHFTGATASTDGVQGLVPGPLAGDEDKFLKADGTWDTAGSAVNVVQTTGTSTTDVMSQNAVTGMVFRDPSTKLNVQIGNSAAATGATSISIGNSSAGGQMSIAMGRYATATARESIAIGSGAYAGGQSSININGGGKATGFGEIRIGNGPGDSDHPGAVAIGYGSYASANGEFNIGDKRTTGTAYGYNNSRYRLLTGLYDGQSAHDAATKGQLDSISIQNAGAPTASTVGSVGQLLQDTTNGDLYICTAVDTTDPQNPVYTWEEVGAGGGGGIVELTSADYNYHRTGSTDDGIAPWLLDPGVYVTDRSNAIAIYHNKTTAAGYSAGSILVITRDGSSTTLLSIRSGEYDMYTVVTSDGTFQSVKTILTSSDVLTTTGTNNSKPMSQNATTSMIFADPATKAKVQIGSGSSNAGTNGITIGYQSINQGAAATVVGPQATIYGANSYGAVALGQGATVATPLTTASDAIALGRGAKATRAGEINISDNTWRTAAFNGTQYRLVSGLHDGQDAHDAATVAQGNTLSSTAPTTSTEGVLGQLFTDTANGVLYHCTAIDTTDPNNPVYTWSTVGGGGSIATINSTDWSNLWQ